MSTLLGILAGIGSVIALVLIIALFVKKEYAIRREIIIQSPRLRVFEYVKSLKNQDHYNKWVMKDPAMKKEFRGIDGTAGFVYAWDGNKEAGKGELEIKRITEGERMESEIRFERPMAVVSQMYIATEDAGSGQTKVTWEMKSRMPYPMNLMTLFTEKMLGKDMEESLANLKRILEN